MNMKMNFSMDEIRLKVEEYIKKGGRAAGRPVLTAYYVLTADSTPESEKTNIMIALVAIVFPTSIEDLLGQVFMVGKGFAAVYAYKKVKKYITPQIKDKVEAKLDEWFHGSSGTALSGITVRHKDHTDLRRLNLYREFVSVRISIISVTDCLLFFAQEASGQIFPYRFIIEF